MIDNSEIEEVMEILESLEDETLAVSLLQEFNEKTKALGQLVMNMDKSLEHDEWKENCDQAKKDVEEIIKKIKDL